LIAAKYGAYIFKQLGIFDTIRVCDPADLRKVDFKDIKYGGFLAVSQSGVGKNLHAALTLAYESNFTCFNIVNVEDSPITKVIDNINKQKKKV
jgi:fructoselysine-6-P-deglycase FrlB-like protein